MTETTGPPQVPADPYAARPWLAQYPAGVPADYDFPLVPLTRLLDDAADSFPNGRAIVFLDAALTYRQLKDSVDRFAGGLAALGVGKGDRVALVLPNCPQAVIALFATLRLGAVVVQHNPLSTRSELRTQLSDCGARVLVCLDRSYDTVAAVREQTEVQHVVVGSIADYLPVPDRLALRLPTPAARKRRRSLTADLPKGADVRAFAELLKSAPVRQSDLDASSDLALLLYTGGTTGAAKGAMLTHHNLVSNAYMNRLWDTEAVAGAEVTLAVLPLFHAYGLTVAMSATILLGGTLVLVPRFDLDEVLGMIDTWRPTMFPGVPPIYQALAAHPFVRDHDLSSIRVCVSGAMRLPEQVQAGFERVSGARLIEGYGLTETSPSTHCNPVTGERRPGTIGLPLPGTRARIVDAEDPSVTVPIGTPGELAVAGPQVFSGYWNSQVEGLFTDDGYVLTGDIAVMDADGWFTVVDRKKELVISGGFNVYPSEVEAVLATVPGVAESVVVGVPDRFRGETVKAYVVAAADAPAPELDDMLQACRRELAAYKVPKAIELVDDLPRSDVGKVLRRVLVEQEREKAAAATEAAPASTPGGRPRPD